jgi:alpha-L-fucosidase 2
MEHIAYIKTKPVLSGKESTPDGAITGNGDLSCILGNSPKGLRLYIAKSDLWLIREMPGPKGMKPLCNIDIDVPQDMYDNYYVEQDMDKAEIRCLFRNATKRLLITVRIHKTENSGTVEISGNYGETPVAIAPPDEASKETVDVFNDGDIYVSGRKFLKDDEILLDTLGYCALKKVSDNKYYFCAATNFDVENPKEQVLDMANNITEDRCAELKKQHAEAWREFWNKSSFKLSDELLENWWYASVYLMAVCSGNTKFPPGLYANFITKENINWASDYHLNYNYQGPFYGACITNHVEFTDGYHVPLEQFVPKGQRDAQKLNCGGVFFPVGILPFGIYSEYTPGIKFPFERLSLGQKSNAIHAADILAFRWKYTRDKEYAREHAYPFIKECLKFFEDYAVFEDGRFSIKKDAAHEVPYYADDFDEKKYEFYINDTNNLVTLGMLRLGLESAIDMANALDVDRDRVEMWQFMLDHLTPFPTFIRHFQRVFRYTEIGMDWNDSNDIGLQHIYPAGCIGLSSDKKTLRTARNSFWQNGRWLDGNSCCSFYPCAVRIGINPKIITKNLTENVAKKGLPNMLFNYGGGCLENCSIVPNTLSEMALISHQGILRVFEVWDKSIDCEYKHLRAYGGFVVDGSIKDGKIGDITVYSECGEKLRFSNPFKKCVVITSDGEHEFDTAEVEIDTHKDEKIVIKSAE